MNPNRTHESLRSAVISYGLGFFGSLILSLLAFSIVLIHVDSGHRAYAHDTIIAVVLGAALIQLIVQFVCFLHAMKGRNRRWDFAALALGVLFVGTIIAGSLWIMRNLNDRMMPSPAAQEQYMSSQDM